MPDDTPTLADLMGEAGDPHDIDDVARLWLGTPTWGQSFAVLSAARRMLVSQAGLDAVLRAADGDERSVHAAILQALAGGMDEQFVQTVVTHRDAARAVAEQALRNGHDPVLRVVLALNSALGASDEGAALFLASGLSAGDREQMLAACAAAAASDSAAARRVADQLAELVGQGLAPEADAQGLLAALRG